MQMQRENPRPDDYMRKFAFANEGETIDYPCISCNPRNGTFEYQQTVKANVLAESGEINRYELENFAGVGRCEVESEARVFACTDCSQLLLYFLDTGEKHFATEWTPEPA